MAFTQCHFLDTGYCLTRECNLFRGGGLGRVQCHCMVALLHHPEEGWGLWDTGYAPRILEVTRSFPNRFYRWAAPLPPQPDRSVLSQLGALRLAAGDIRWIVLSHLHGDHVAGLRDFPHARLMVAQEARDYAASRRGLSAVAKAYLNALLPEDFRPRAQLVSSFPGRPLEGLGGTYDLFGDGVARLFPLPGHARGQLGMLAETERGLVLCVADSVYHRDSIRHERLAGPLTNLIADDPAQVLPTIRRLRQFTAANPEAMIFPTHCSATYRELAAGVAHPC